MLKVIQLAFDYPEEPLLKNINIHLPAGSLLYLQGKNGAGKTSLLKLIAGLYQPMEGQIQFFEKPIEADLRAYQSQLCFIGHQPAVSPFLTLRENCYFDAQYGSNTVDIAELAALFRLETHLDRLCVGLSAGQKRQVALLRLWMSNAKLWLLDEPFVALDEFACSVLLDKINLHKSQGGGVILTSHQALPLKASNYQEYML